MIEIFRFIPETVFKSKIMKGRFILFNAIWDHLFVASIPNNAVGILKTDIRVSLSDR